MPQITEIAPDIYRLSFFLPVYNLQFNHFLVLDDEPLLWTTGMRRMFPEIRDTLSQILDPAKLRWVSFSHFEVDECGALNEWLTVAPQAQPLCTLVGAMVNMGDFANREARPLTEGETLTTGKYRFRMVSTPHLPHGWDAGVLFEETQRTLFCSDLFHHDGDVEALTENDVLGRVREALTTYQAGPLMNYLPYSTLTGRQLSKLADLAPATLATMHGSSYRGDGSQALRDLDGVMREVLVGNPA